MAVSGDKTSRFGWGQSEIRVNKPVALRPAFPRFLAVGDRATFGSVVTNQLSAGGQAVVTIKSLDPSILRIDGVAQRSTAVGAGQSAEVRFTASALGIGKARVQMTARLNGESDAYEDVLPVEVLVSPETVAAYGQTDGAASETLALPAGVVPGFGGLMRGDVLHGAHRPGRGRAVPARVSVRLRRAEGIAGARTGPGRGSRIRVPDAGGERRAGAAACAVNPA